ncbi:MAG: dTDP-4-dehydrorhamnose reductase [Chitinophagales bacterium]
MKRVLVTGSLGQLGKALVAASANFQIEFLCTDHQNLDITNQSAIAQFLQEHAVDAVINCAAYTAVDKAESEPDAAQMINAVAPGILAEETLRRKVKLVHISTDFVFNGNQSHPYQETDATDPLSVYGKTKLAGEELVLQANSAALVVRTSWLYSPFGNNFVKTMLRLCRERDVVKVVADQTGTPTYASDLARAILTLIQDQPSASGVLHYSNEGTASWYDLAMAVRDVAGLKTRIEPIPTTSYPTPAIRPKFSVMDKSMFKQLTGLDIPYWRHSLERCMKELQS